MHVRLCIDIRISTLLFGLQQRACHCYVSTEPLSVDTRSALHVPPPIFQRFLASLDQSLAYLLFRHLYMQAQTIDNVTDCATTCKSQDYALALISTSAKAAAFTCRCSNVVPAEDAKLDETACEPGRGGFAVFYQHSGTWCSCDCRSCSWMRGCSLQAWPSCDSCWVAPYNMVWSIMVVRSGDFELV